MLSSQELQNKKRLVSIQDDQIVDIKLGLQKTNTEQPIAQLPVSNNQLKAASIERSNGTTESLNKMKHRYDFSSSQTGLNKSQFRNLDLAQIDDQFIKNSAYQNIENDLNYFEMSGNKLNKELGENYYKSISIKSMSIERTKQQSKLSRKSGFRSRKSSGRSDSSQGRRQESLSNPTKPTIPGTAGGFFGSMNKFDKEEDYGQIQSPILGQRCSTLKKPKKGQKLKLDEGLIGSSIDCNPNITSVKQYSRNSRDEH